MQLSVMVNAFWLWPSLFGALPLDGLLAWRSQDRGLFVSESHPALQLIDRLLLVPVPKLSCSVLESVISMLFLLLFVVFFQDHVARP